MDRVEHILVATLQAGRVEAGLDLVGMYYREWSEYLKDSSEGEDVMGLDEEVPGQKMLEVRKNWCSMCAEMFENLTPLTPI